ncbi:helix-turn-helix transcriptional regulator [Phreatobacter sp. HK31-P]
MQKTRRIDLLPASLPPIAVRREHAAAVIDVSPKKFDELVKDGRMPPARKIDGRRVWIIDEIRARALDLPTADDPADANPFDDL